PAEDVDQAALVRRVIELLVDRFVRAVSEHDQRRRLVSDLLVEVIFAEAQLGEDLRAVDAERVDHDPCLRAVERHSEDTDNAVAHGANVDLVRGVRGVEGGDPGAGLARCGPRRNAPGARAVDEHIEAAAEGLLKVRDLEAREARPDRRPGLGAAGARSDPHAEQAEVAIAPRGCVAHGAARPLWFELGAHPAAADAVLAVVLPRQAERDEAAAAVTEAGLHDATKGRRTHVARRVRVAELQDANVFVAAPSVDAGVETGEPLEEWGGGLGALGGPVPARAGRGPVACPPGAPPRALTATTFDPPAGWTSE